MSETEIASPATLARAAERLRRTGRPSPERIMAMKAALGRGGMLPTERSDLWLETLGLTGDSPSTNGRGRLRSARSEPMRRRWVSAPRYAVDPARADCDERVDHSGPGGPAACAGIASGFSHLAAAVARKLLRELPSMTAGQTPPLPRRPQ
ncbi:hypothetical protein [Rhodovulum sp. MB263]|uniref:hypothetical protein n=1 Tax=Rhodovulum sp. (strain MB263) TaxID=308754 RepID=UPI003512AB99